LEEGERMSGVEDRVVSIKFDNKDFQLRVAETISSLDKLNEKLGSLGTGKGFADINAAANSVDLSGMASGVDHIASRFTALGAVAFSVIQNITTSAMGFVEGFAKKDILAPIISGGTSRAQNIEQAKFQFQGLGIDVDKAMQSSLDAVKGTAYGLDEAAKAAAQFGASGIGAGADMTSALRGISGTAALTGRSFGEMAQIFTGSAGTGKVTNQDFLQFATRGLNAAAAYAKVTGKTEAQIHEMAREGQIDFKSFAAAMDQAFGAHATEANKTYQGSLANLHAAMSRLGAAFIGPSEQQQRDLFNAITPAVDSLTEALGPLIDAFIQVKGVLTGNLIKTIQGLDFSGLKLAMPNFALAFKNAFAGVEQLFGVIKSAFSEIFPSDGISVIWKISEAIMNFSEKLKMGGETADKVKSVFKGLFSILSIAWEILKGLASVLLDVVHALFPAAGGLLSFGAGIGDFLTNLKTFLVDGGKLHAFFEKLGEVIVKPIEFISNLAKAIANFFSQSIPDKVSSHFDSIASGANKASQLWSSLVQRFSSVFNVLEKIGAYISTWFKELGQKIANSFSASDFNSVVDVVNVGLLGGITLLLKKFLSGGLKVDLTGGVMSKLSGMFGELTKTLKTMQMQVKAKALMEIAGAVAILTVSIVALSLIDSVGLTKALVAIAVGFAELAATLDVMAKITGAGGAVKLVIISGALIALAIAMDIFAIAIAKLAKLSWSELGRGLTGVAAGLAIFIVATKLLTSNPVTMLAAGVSLIALSIGLLLLSKAIKSFAGMSWAEMGKGLVGVAGGLLLVVAAMKLMPASSVLSSLGLIEMAVGLQILAKAVASFGKMSWKEMGKGLVGIAGALLIVAAAMNLMPITLPITAAGMVILSVALLGMAKAVEVMGRNDLKTLAKGIGAFAAMLLILGIAMAAMQGSIAGAASLYIAAKAISVLAEVLKVVGGLSIAQIATGIGAIAAVLLVLGLAALVMEPIIPALLGLAVALGVIGVAFALFGAGAFLLASAFQLIASTAAVGVEGIKTFIKGFQEIIPLIAATGVALILNFAQSIIGALPALIKVLRALIDQVLDTIIKEVPKLAKALTAIIHAIVDIINNNLPQLIDMGYKIILALMQGLIDHMPEVIAKAVEVIQAFATGISSNMDGIMTAATTIIVGFITALGNHVDELIAAGVSVIVNFLLGLTQDVTTIVEAVTLVITTFIQALTESEQMIIDAGVQALVSFLQGITDNITLVVDTVTTIITQLIQSFSDSAQQIMDAGLAALVSFLNGIANNITQVADAGTNVIVSFINALSTSSQRIIDAGVAAIVKFIHGLGQSAQDIIDAGTEVIIKLIHGIGDDAGKIADAAMKTIVKFVKGLTAAIQTNSADLKSAGKDLAVAIADGLTGGLASKVGEVAGKAAELAHGAIGAAKKVLSIFSPSRVFMEIGEQTGEGFALGLDNNTSAEESAGNLANNIISAFTDTVSQIPDSLANMDAFSPTITPVLDLTKIQSQSTGISDALSGATITPTISIDQANLIASATMPTAASTSDQKDTGPTSIIFEQTINAPEALSTNDIYRNTKSQIAMAKEELNIS
jgi:tape measure domain-containing protein